MDHDTLNWLNLADKFASEGDPKGMRACARELWQLDAESMDGAAVMAEAALYTGDYEEAHALLDEILLDIDAQFALRQVSYMPNGSDDFVSASEKLSNRFCL